MAIDDNTVYGLYGSQVKDLANRIKSSGGVTELTSADYNWPTNNPDGVALWLLDTGTYTRGSSIKVYRNTNTALATQYTDFTVLKEPNYVLAIVGIDESNRLKIFATETTGTAISIPNVLTTVDVVNSLDQVYGGTVLDGRQGKTLKDLIDGLVVKNAGAPTTSTVGTVGQLLEDTTNGKLYICTDATNPYVWEEVGGGGGPTVVQTTGTSTTDVMSQNAVTSMVFADPGSDAFSMRKIRLGAGSSVTANQGTAIGANTQVQGGQGIAINGGNSSMSISGRSAIGIGAGEVTADGAVSLGYFTPTNSTQGKIEVGTTATWTGYSNSNYRLLTGLYDPQSAHDAATKGYVDTLADSKQDVLTAGQNITIAEESGALVISATGGGADAFTTNEWNALWA